MRARRAFSHDHAQKVTQNDTMINYITKRRVLKLMRVEEEERKCLGVPRAVQDDTALRWPIYLDI